MMNMSVTDSLVGRVIGLGGNKINSITVSQFNWLGSQQVCYLKFCLFSCRERVGLR